MARIRGFAPIANAQARVLILGSMPGAESLRTGRYYAHPRNAFWRIMGDLVGARPELPYTQRAQRLRMAGIAVWDVLASCTRRGSLNADIDRDSVQVNDFPGFFAAHPHITRIFFNGSTAEQCFRRHVLRKLNQERLTLTRLPSTSPAHAALGYAAKCRAWCPVRDALKNYNKNN